ncbi:MAG TPA: hypothetical protein DCS63_07830 [Elusimicrobia bacterium]|nr:hypothetical protein [Elusimicrobiota bacterium]
MPFYGKLFLPFRLKLLLVILAAAGAGSYSSYSGFRGALKPFHEDEAGGRLISRLELAAAVIDEDVKSGLALARLTAARTGLREALGRHNANPGLPADKADLSRRLADAASGSVIGLDLVGTDGKVAASLDKRIGLDLSSRADIQIGSKRPYITGPRAENGKIVYEVTVPVPALAGTTARPLGVLRCRFLAASEQEAALRPLRQGGATLVLAKKGGQQLIAAEGPGFAREVNLKSPKGSLFLPAISGPEGAASFEEGISGRMITGWKSIPSPGWIIAARIPFLPAAESSARLLERARLHALLSFILLAAAAFFAAGLLAAPLCEAGRQTAFLLEQCGIPAADRKRLCEPGPLAGAIEEAAGILKRQSSRGLELETETEKLREEEADLQSQNDELEKLNKYLMERETKISELKKEISDLREKVGGGVQE